MDKVGEDEEKTIEEASNSVDEMRTHQEDESIVAELVDSIEKGSTTDPSNSHMVSFESDMEDEKVLEYFRSNNSVRTEVTERNNFPYLNKSQGTVLEGIIKSSSSASNEDSSTDSDFDSRYYFDGSLPVSAHVEESETDQDESPVPKDENKVPLLCQKQPMQQPTSWRNCCGLLQILRAAKPYNSGTRSSDLQ